MATFNYQITPEIRKRLDEISQCEDYIWLHSHAPFSGVTDDFAKKRIPEMFGTIIRLENEIVDLLIEQKQRGEIIENE